MNAGDILRIAQTLIAVFGVIVIYFAVKAYSRRRSRAMLLLALGFAIVTAGAAGAGLLFELADADLLIAEAIQATCQAFGFGIIVYSLLVVEHNASMRTFKGVSE